MIAAVVTDPGSGQPVVVAQLERQRLALEKDIKDACSEFLSEPDWEKNMGVVDQLNRATYLCPFGIKYIRAQLKTKNPEIEILALQLTETIIKNCPSSHHAVAGEDFMRYLVKVGTDQRAGGKWTQMKSKIKKKNTTMNAKQVRGQCIEKALLILKMLAMAYADSQLYPVFQSTMKQLQRQNVRFPETNKDESLNVFSPMHSSNALDEFENQNVSSAMGSVQNVTPQGSAHLEMIRPVIPIPDVTNHSLLEAQGASQLLFDIINVPTQKGCFSSYETIADLTAMLQNTQQQIVVMISDGQCDETLMFQAIQVNEVVNQVLEDAQAIMNGTKRHYQKDVDVNKLVKQQSDSSAAEADESKDPNDPENENEVRLEESISLDDDDALLQIDKPDDGANKMKKGKKKKRQSIDLLNMGGQADQDLLNMGGGDGKGKGKEIEVKREESDDLMGFLGMDAQSKAPLSKVDAPMVFDPLAMNNGNVPSAAPPQAFAQYGAANTNTNNYAANNANVFRDGQQTIQPVFAANNAKVLATPQQPQKRMMSSIQRGNDSVLNVLTGEPSPSQSYPASSDTSPNKEEISQPGSANNSIKPDDPFAQMADPFADMSGNAFDDATPKHIKPKPKPTQNTSQPKPQPASDDPFADIGGGAFDDPIMAAPPKSKKSKPKPKSVAKAKPAVLVKQNSDNIILDMFASGAPEDPNHPEPAKAKVQKAAASKTVDDNPFGAANPFGSSASANAADNSNPFASVENLADNPFGDSVEDIGADAADTDNPFAMFTPMDAQTKKEEDKDPFMDDRDPFADM